MHALGLVWTEVKLISIKFHLKIFSETFPSKYGYQVNLIKEVFHRKVEQGKLNRIQWS